ncbi:hypothetical protein [Haloarcula hispanica]|uniref:hypothetical protein n=1 Tax=Haloarcula hispanica TaxID=51589 RepID=UPI001644B342|nr:hypothetical protein [Haloarcula hispanica]
MFPYVVIKQIQNGIAHLSINQHGDLLTQTTKQVSVSLKTDSEQGDFYRVELNDDGELIEVVEYADSLTDQLAVEIAQTIALDDVIRDSSEVDDITPVSELPPEERERAEEF